MDEPSIGAAKILPFPPSRTGKPWTAKDYQDLLDMDAEGCEHADMAEVLGRTLQEISKRLERLRSSQ